MLALKLFAGYSSNEIGALLQLPPGTIRSRQHRALKKMKKSKKQMQGKSGTGKIRNSEDQKQRIPGTKNIRKRENQKQAEGSIRYG